MRKTLFYIFVLIMAYLLFVHYLGFGKDLGAADKFGVDWIKALQGPAPGKGGG